MAGTKLINLMSYSSALAQSQRFFIESKPTRLSLIFKFLTEFPTDVLKIWTIHRWYVCCTNVTTEITLRFTVTSVTSSPRLWSTTILMELQFTRRCRPEIYSNVLSVSSAQLGTNFNTVDILSMTSVKQYDP